MLTLLLASPLAVAATWTLPDLLHAVARNQHHAVRFVQTTHLSSLTHPLQTSGLLSYRKPDTMVMKQMHPTRATYRVVDGRLYVHDAQGRHSVSISHVPQVMAIVSSFEGLLSGNQALLLHDYTARLSGSVHAWRLLLVPRLRSLAQVVRTIEVRGHGGQLSEVKTMTPKGDFSVMRLSP